MEDGIFEAVLTNGETFIGGNLQYPRWRKCPDGISSLKIKLPYGDSLVLEKYEKFNFLIGAIKNLNDREITISHMFALGLKENSVTSYRITIVSFKGEKHKIGDITVRIFPFGKEGMGRTATSGWKKGII